MSAKRQPKPIDRRRFLQDAGRGVAGCALAGMGLAQFISDARALPARAIRPPGALEEDEFPVGLHPVRALRAGLSL